MPASMSLLAANISGGNTSTWPAARDEPRRDLRPAKRNPIRSRIRSRCDSAERSVMQSRAPISRLVRPSATRAATSRWRGVRVGTARCRSDGQLEEATDHPGERVRIADIRKVRTAGQQIEASPGDAREQRPALPRRRGTIGVPVYDERARAWIRESASLTSTW